MTAVTTAQTIADFEKYVGDAASSELKPRIARFLSQLVSARTRDGVKHLCDEEVAWLNQRYGSAGSRTSYVSAYRNAIESCYCDRSVPEGLLSEKKTMKHGIVARHVAMDYLFADSKDYQEVQAKGKAKTAKQRDNLVGVEVDAVLTATEDALKSDDWRILAAGLIMACHSRPSDMLALGDFDYCSKYRVRFTSRAKKRGEAATGDIWLLVEAEAFMEALHRLRRISYIRSLRGLSAAEIDKKTNSSLNRGVVEVYGDLISPPHGEKSLSAKNLRASGVPIAYYLYGPERQTLGRFAELQLLHDSEGAAANYEDYYCIKDGKRQDRADQQRQDEDLELSKRSFTSPQVRVPRHIKQTLKTRWGDASEEERMEQVFTKAEEADRLAAELERRNNEIERLKRQLEQQPPAPAAAEDSHTAPSAPVDDIRAVSNAELLGSRKRGAAEEKLRRTVDAIQEYNAGRPLNEQIAINKGSLRKLTKLSPTGVNKWADENKAMLSEYESAQGHSYRQNVGKDLSVIKWSEDAYGAYEWPDGYFS